MPNNLKSCFFINGIVTTDFPTYKATDRFYSKRRVFYSYTENKGAKLESTS